MKMSLRWPAALLLAAAVPAFAVNMPMRIPFQGKLIDPSTNNPKNGSFSMQFKIYNAPTGGSALFTETQTVQVTNGVFSVQIGTVSALGVDLFSGASAYLGVTVDADAEMSPRQPLSMSPYAYTAAQLASPQDIRINPGTSYSTFTSAGNLLMRYGVSGTTATFMVVTATGTGSNSSIVASSSIVMNDGYLKIAANSKGIDASGTGILASTGVFTSSVTAQQFFGIGVTTGAILDADVNRTSNAVLDDSQLQVPVGANQVYTVYGLLKSSSTSATPDIRIAFTVPAGATIDIAWRSTNGALNSVLNGALRTSGVNSGLIPISANIVNNILIMGSVVTGATPGYLVLQWGQNTTNATATTITQGSFIAATRIR